MPAKRVALCIASRGYPRQLCETLHRTLQASALPGTTAVIGLDEDDPTLTEARAMIDALDARRIVLSVAPRADTIGAVYNRCAAAVEADLYLNSADDASIVTPGWDAVVARESAIFPDDIGMIGLGVLPFPSSILPALEATTRRLIEKMGYFLQDYTPFWWMDNWLYEIAAMIGRTHFVPMDVEFVGPLRTRGLRDLLYWASFYDEMRVHRRAIAESILSDPDLLMSAERRQELRDGLDDMCAMFARSLVAMRERALAEGAQDGGYDAPDDERYRRVKARAEKTLQELGHDRADAREPRPARAGERHAG